MFQSNRDIRWAILCQQLIVEPPPEQFGAGYDETSIDLHLVDVREAKVWDVSAFARDQAGRGAKGPELHLGQFNYGQFSGQYLIDPPEEAQDEPGRAGQLVCRRGGQVIVKPGGFLLWTTK